MNFSRFFDNGAGVVAYLRDGKPDCAFVFKLSPGSPLPGQSLNQEELLKAWLAAAAAGGGVKFHAIHFFPPAESVDQAKAFIESGIVSSLWDQLLYWPRRTPAIAPQLFPSGQLEATRIKQIVLGVRKGLQPQAPARLSEFDVAWETVAGATGTALVIGKPGYEWVAGDDGFEPLYAKGSVLRIDFEDPNGIDTGALELDIPQDGMTRLPLKFAFYRTTEGALQMWFDCWESLAAKFIDSGEEEHSGPVARLALDPRDRSEETFQDNSSRSRIEFIPEREFATHFRTDRGQTVLLKVDRAKGRGVGRLLFQIVSGETESWTVFSEQVSFAPEGAFIFAGVKGGSGALKTHRIITGSTATEGVDFEVGSLLWFDSRGPATLHEEPDVFPGTPPADEPLTADPLPDLIHSGRGFITTSYLAAGPRVQGDGTPAGKDFYSEPERAPLFALPKGASDAPAALARSNPPMGSFTTPLPVFPWGGVAAAANDALTGGPLPFYEHRFLAEARRRLVGAKITGASDQPQPLEFGISSQGIISSFRATDITGLFFGNPTGLDGTEYSIRIQPNAGMEEGYLQIQRALRANDLFLLWHQPVKDISAVIEASAAFKVASFEFGIDISSGTSESVLILKYYRDRSLKDLVGDERLWSCKDLLAPKTKSKIIEDLALVDGKPPGPLAQIWENRDWQGMLLLNLTPAEEKPELIKALEPAMDAKKFRVHHAGLNFLPVKGDAVSVSPVRPGSAFGLVRYDAKDAEDVGAARAGDKEPGGPTSTIQRGYKLQVQKLEIEFANSAVSRFEARVDAQFTHLFWDKTEGDQTTIPLTGSYESRPTATGGKEDIFSLRCDQEIPVRFTDSWLDTFLLSRAEFTVTSSTADRLVSFLGFNGKLTFKENVDLKLFKVESVSVQRLGLEFDHQPASKEFHCRFRADSIRAEVVPGDAVDSLLSILPLKFLGFRIAIDDLLNLDKMGFAPLGGIADAKLFQFAFDLELDLGFLGNLGGAKGLKLPMLLGWRAGGLDKFKAGLGISFPNWTGKSFEIGIQRFFAIRAAKAALKPCKDAADKVQALAIVLSEARMVFFGHEWPKDTRIDVVLFVPIANGRKMSWALARTGAGDEMLKYLGGGHRIRLPSGSSTREVVDNFKTTLEQADGTNPCSLINLSDSSDGWTIVADFKIGGIVEVWLAISDREPVYGLRLGLTSGFEIDALYRQVTEGLGMFAVEVTLPASWRTFQIGAATVRLPAMGVEVYTDGGFRIDLGYPWNLDFRRSFQLEIVIFLGSGGFWFGHTSAAAIRMLALEKKLYDFSPLDDPALLERNYQAMSAAMAMRAGIGRSLDLGILKGEASLTVFCTLEGAVGYLKNDSQRTPHLYSIRGTMGIMIHIWAEVNFVVLRAKAEFCAYVLTGFELRRVLARKGGTNYYLTLPVKIFAEVGIYVHLEVWVTIGCVRVKLFDLNFSGTWRWEETIGNLHPDPLEPSDAPGPAFLEVLETLPDFGWDHNYKAFEPNEPLGLFASMLPCAVDALDKVVKPGVITQLMVRVDDGFGKLARYMLGWVMGIRDAEGGRMVFRGHLIQRRRELQDPKYWLDGPVHDLNIPLDTLKGQFKPAVTALHPGMDPADYAALPGWPGVSWRFKGGGTPDSPMVAVLPDEVRDAPVADGFICSFVDYLRALTDGLLAEADRVVQANWSSDQDPDMACLTWNELWTKLKS